MPIKGPTTDHVEIRAWAEAHCAVPAEVLPHVVDSEPALLRMVLSDQFGPDRPNLRQLSWDEFFVKFDWLGLTFVYDAEYNEILQIVACTAKWRNSLGDIWRNGCPSELPFTGRGSRKTLVYIAMR